jgi:F0F1-type ATP synthase membrane subunit c/vacuolar-type H+-ATPase subunit K
MEWLTQFGSAIAIWLAAIWVAIWQGYLTFKAMETLGKNPKMSTYYLTIAILWIALVDSAAI